MYESQSDSFMVSNSMDLYDPRCVQRCFKTLCKKYNFTIHFHALRHTYATTCMMKGMDMKSLSEILGHSSVSITLSLYTLPLSIRKGRWMRCLNNKIGMKAFLLKCL